MKPEMYPSASRPMMMSITDENVHSVKTENTRVARQTIIHKYHSTQTKLVHRNTIKQTIKRFHHKVATSEALGPGSMLVNRGRRESLGKEECL